MAGKAVLRYVIHAFGADLHLHIRSFLILDGDVQALVAVGLGIGHPVPQASGIGLIFFRHEGIHPPAEVLFQLVVLPVAVYDEADGEYVENALERHVLLHHLLPDGISGLGAHLQLVPDALGVQFGLERLDELRHQFLAVLLPRLQLIGNEAILFRLGVFEVNIFHLPLHVVQAQLVSQRDIQQERFQDLLVTAGLGEHPETSHHLQTVGQFEHGHARVPGILDDEFLIVLRLQARILGLDGGNLVQALHQRADSFSPFRLLYLQTAHAAGLVQVHGGNALFRKTNLVGHYLRHGIRMADEGGPVVPGEILQSLRRRRAGLVYEGCAGHATGWLSFFP